MFVDTEICTQRVENSADVPVIGIHGPQDDVKQAVKQWNSCGINEKKMHSRVNYTNCARVIKGESIKKGEYISICLRVCEQTTHRRSLTDIGD